MGPGSPARHSVFCRGLLFLIGCFWDNGHLYRADQPSAAPGHRCLNWLDAQSGLAFAPESGECPSRAAGERAEAVSQPRPMVPSLPSQAPATTATAGTRTRTRAGPGATSAARLELPRSDLARTCAAQVPAPDPAPRASRSCRSTRRARAAARRRPAPPRPALSDWPGLSPGRETRSSLAGAAARNELILRERLVNNRGQLGPAPRPSSAPGSPLGEPRKSVSLVHALSSPLGLGAGWYSVCCVLGTLSQPCSTQFAGSKIKEKFSDLPKAVAGSRFESKFLGHQSGSQGSKDDSLGLNGICKHVT